MWASQYSKECQKNYEKSQSNVSTKQSNLKNSQKQSKKSIHNCSFCDFSFVNEQILNEHILSLHVMPLDLKNSEPRDVEMIYSHEFPSMPPARASNVRVQVPKTSPNAQKPRPKYPTQQAQEVANLVGPSAQMGTRAQVGALPHLDQEGQEGFEGNHCTNQIALHWQPRKFHNLCNWYNVLYVVDLSKNML